MIYPVDNFNFKEITNKKLVKGFKVSEVEAAYLEDLRFSLATAQSREISLNELIRNIIHFAALNQDIYLNNIPYLEAPKITEPEESNETLGVPYLIQINQDEKSN